MGCQYNNVCTWHPLRLSKPQLWHASGLCPVPTPFHSTQYLSAPCLLKTALDVTFMLIILACSSILIKLQLQIATNLCPDCKLLLNPFKTEFLLLGMRLKVKNSKPFPFSFGKSYIQKSEPAKNLGMKNFTPIHYFTTTSMLHTITSVTYMQNVPSNIFIPSPVL